MGIDDARCRANRGARLVACGIVAEKPHQHRGPAQRGNVARDIAGATEHRLDPAQQQHRHRRFRRYPLDSAIGEAIEDDVAQAQNRGAGKIHYRA